MGKHIEGEGRELTALEVLEWLVPGVVFFSISSTPGADDEEPKIAVARIEDPIECERIAKGMLAHVVQPLPGLIEVYNKEKNTIHCIIVERGSDGSSEPSEPTSA